MIRLTFGFLLVLGSAGTIETDPTASLLGYTILAAVGLALMYWPIADGTFSGDK